MLNKTFPSEELALAAALALGGAALGVVDAITEEVSGLEVGVY